LSRPTPPPPEFRDLGVRLVLSPVIGLAFSVIAGLYEPFDRGSVIYWLSAVWFMAMPFLVWTGARAIIYHLPSRIERIPVPLGRIGAAIGLNLMFTAACVVAMLWTWYALAGAAVPWPAVLQVAGMATLATLLITHTYETMFVIHGRLSAEVERERLERAVTQAELAALKLEVDPHFLFNSLNALAELIESDPERAVSFNAGLAEVYRYMLNNRRVDLVPLSDEIRFASRYFSLLQLRFETAIRLELPSPKELAGWQIAPLVLQILIENALKHNEFSGSQPLTVTVSTNGGVLEVRNPYRPRAASAPRGIGLKNLGERCELLLGRNLETSVDENTFVVRLPLKKN